MKKLILACAFMVLTSFALAAPNGNYNLEIKTKFLWPMAANVSGDKITLKSRGRTTIHGVTNTKSASATKIIGTANFSTKICASQSVVSITLKFSKDGKFKSGKASGKCIKNAGGTAKITGRVVLK